MCLKPFKNYIREVKMAKIVNEHPVVCSVKSSIKQKGASESPFIKTSDDFAS